MRTLTLIILSFFLQSVSAQEYKADVSNSKLSVTGTSTLHDWECVVKSFKGGINAKIENNRLASIEDFNFQFKVKSLESGKSSMNKKTYEALKEEDFPIISYQGTAEIISEYSAIFSGKMKMAGTEKEVVTKVKISYEDGKIFLSGEKELKLTDFNIDPPTAVFGTIKTGDEVAIHYNIQLSK
ncbi:YceI family protein [Mesonia maritima]|uniref:Lipid/polyisoprenoid-binding YceI-like domain-containing protein n=1 Tax=Mesonia maritima TaxID=1793873 RepID=A0ABU1K8P7_9FLAO|nr:YceI family protein [Mesonia maritima]MDR6301981.1 hypothetical protein [Mesonia maritima]